MSEIFSKINKTIMYIFGWLKNSYNNSKTGTVITEYFEKDIKLLPPLKWAGIAIGAFIADAAVIGAIAADMVNKFNNMLSVFRRQPPPDLPGFAWYLTHPFKASWMFLRHTMGAPTSVTPVYNTWIGLNVICGLGVAAWLGYKKYKKYSGGESDQERDIRKVQFKKVKFDIESEIQKTPDGQVFMGMGEKRKPIRVDWKELTEHVHVLGGSGTGKTSLAVIPICVQAIRHRLPVAAIDFKGDKQAIHMLTREVRKAGKKFYLFSLHPGIGSNSYNPIGSGNALSKVERVLTALDLVYDGPAKFYTYSQQATFIPLLEYFDSQGVVCTLQDIWNILADAELMKELTGQKVDIGHIKGLWAALTPYARLNQINVPDADIDLAGVLESGDVVYFDLRSAVAPKLATGLGKMIALDLENQAAFRTQADRIALIAIDEFQNMACDAFRNVISKVRSANYAMVLANQSLGDLRNVGGGFLDTIGTNTKTKIVFSVDDPYDVENYVKKSGSVQVRVESESRSRSGGPLASNISVGKSTHIEEKGMIHANQLLLLPFGKTVIYRRGEIAKFGNHAHLITKAEKDLLEQAPYPEPAKLERYGDRAVTAGQIIDGLKRQMLERKRQEREQNHAQGQPRQRPGQGENAGVESEDFVI